MVLTAAGGGLAYATMGTAVDARYRTAVVTTGDVQQELSLVGTAHMVDQQIARIGVSGTVSSVKVAVGDEVKKGQILATLSTTQLDAAVTKAEADLATSRADLETAEDANNTDNSSSTSNSARAASNDSAGGASGMLQAATQALQTAEATCSTGGAPSMTATPTVPPSSTASASPTTTSTPEPSSSVTATATPTSGTSTAGTSTADTSTPSGDCLDALGSALTLQQHALAALRSTATTTTTTTTANPTSTGSSTTSNGAGATSRASDVTTLKAKIRAAEVALEQARLQRQHATVTAPAAGSVASVPFAVGDSVTSGDGITLIGTGAVDVTVQVPAASLKDVKRGAAATVRTDAASTTVPAKVTAISLLATSSSSGSTTYATTVHVADPGQVRFTDGGAANVLITIKTVKNVVVVPNSALSDGFVTVMEAGVTRRTQVTTGAVGALTTQVIKGVATGDEVVLADLSQAVPANSTNNTRLPFGGGTFPGGGQFPAGGPPANFRAGG